jgi:NDP-sugar pyrophosphorylase family protein
MQCLVLAAGLGSRLRSVSNGRPKPLMEICGKSILGWNLHLLRRFGFEHTFINLHYEANLVRATALQSCPDGLELSFSEEETLLGTAGAARRILPAVDDQLLILYGDNLFNIDLDRFQAAHKQSNAVATIALFDKNISPHTGIAGGHVVLGKAGQVSRFVEGASATTEPSLVNAGAYILERSVVESISEEGSIDFGRNVFPDMLSHDQEIAAHVIDENEFCLGLDTPESFEAAHRLVKEGKVVLL